MIVFLTHKINPKSFLSNFWGSLQIYCLKFKIYPHLFSTDPRLSRPTRSRDLLLRALLNLFFVEFDKSRLSQPARYFARPIATCFVLSNLTTLACCDPNGTSCARTTFDYSHTAKPLRSLLNIKACFMFCSLNRGFRSSYCRIWNQTL